MNWLGRSCGGLGFGNLLLLGPLFNELGVLEAGNLMDVVAYHQYEFEFVIFVLGVFQFTRLDLILGDLPRQAWENLSAVGIAHKQGAVTELVVKGDLLSYWEISLLFNQLHRVFFIFLVELVVDANRQWIPLIDDKLRHVEKR